MDKKRILVVDDEPSARLLIARVLENAGYEVTSYETGEEGLQHLEETATDLLMVDKVLPRMSGLEVMARARAKLPELPVVLMTAVPDAMVVFEHKPDVYVAKPFRDLKLLSECIERAFTLKKEELERVALQKKLSEVQAQLGKKS